MKNQISSTSCACKLCLMTFIFLCSVFMSKNAFSIRWQHHHMSAYYFPEENAIDIKFIFYENASEFPDSQNFMRRFEILYSEDTYHFTPLVTGVSLTQTNLDNMRWITVTNNIEGKKINFVNGKKDPASSKIGFPIKKDEYKEGKILKKSVYSTINIKWTSSKSKRVKTIKIKGVWRSAGDTLIDEDYQL